jgi:hypothetical protein
MFLGPVPMLRSTDANLSSGRWITGRSALTDALPRSESSGDETLSFG